MTPFYHKLNIYFLLCIYALIAAFTIIFFDGTGGSGDSIHHYLYAKYATAHPENFFNHWAKPLYVLLACSFAQFGFVGMKIFNALVALFTIFFTYRTSKALKINNSILVAVIMLFTPLYYRLTFSGLTEPLFALLIAMSLYFSVKKKHLLACLLVSFLPMVRSEGLIITSVFGGYYLLKGQWKLLPFLLFGHIAYSIAGFFVHGDLLWVFNKIPYAKLDGVYGSGKLFHFVEKLIYVLGVPLLILFWMGMIAFGWKSLKKKIDLETTVLVFGGFWCFFVAHSLFWYLGIFNSMGLKRVLIGVMPLMAITMLYGFNFLTDDLLKKWHIPQKITKGAFLFYMLLFPFTNNPAAINWKKDMQLSMEQQAAIEIANFLDNNENDHRLMYAHPYLSEVLNIDHFDRNVRLDLTKSDMPYLTSGDLIIWEDWFALEENQVTREYLDHQSDLIKIHEIVKNNKDGKAHYVLYQKI